jgi:hypothetical protein
MSAPTTRAEQPTRTGAAERPTPAEVLAEARAIVLQRLVDAHPEVPGEELSRALDRATPPLAGARVTQYLPVLLERAARRQLQTAGGR